MKVRNGNEIGYSMFYPCALPSEFILRSPGSGEISQDWLGCGALM